MKVFIGWSGERSHLLAKELHDWLPKVIQSVKPWLSSEDIDKGAKWPTRLSQSLESTNVGVICVTPENQHAPWILFEAGALSKALEDSLVSALLFGFESPAPAGPLSLFQNTSIKRDDIFKLVKSINGKIEKGNRLGDIPLRDAFEKWWPDLETAISRINPTPPEEVPRREDSDVLSEILEVARRLDRQSAPRPWPDEPASTGFQRLIGQEQSILATRFGLDDLSHTILAMRFGLDGRQEMTSKEVSEALSIPEPLINRMEGYALNTLRQPSEAQKRYVKELLEKADQTEQDAE